MSTSDILILGGYAFEDFSPPESMPFGGKHSIAIHKLPGGNRVIDTLGPDDDDITWRGVFFGDFAYEDSLLIDSFRTAGSQIPLIFGGQFFTVIISHFSSNIKRFPNWIEYNVTCVVVFNPMSMGGSVISSVDSLIGGDLSTSLGMI